MFKVTEFYVQSFALSAGERRKASKPEGPLRRTRDEGEARRWAEEACRRLDLRPGEPAHEVLVYSVVGEPVFDLWAEPRVRERYRAGGRR